MFEKNEDGKWIMEYSNNGYCDTWTKCNRFRKYQHTNYENLVNIF